MLHSFEVFTQRRGKPGKFEYRQKNIKIAAIYESSLYTYHITVCYKMHGSYFDQVNRKTNIEGTHSWPCLSIRRLNYRFIYNFFQIIVFKRLEHISNGSQAILKNCKEEDSTKEFWRKTLKKNSKEEF